MKHCKKAINIITVLALVWYASSIASGEEEEMSCVIVKTSADNMWAKVIDETKAIFQDVGYRTEVYDINILLSETVPLIEQADAFVILPGSSLPRATSKCIEKLLDSGKFLIVFSAPIWKDSRLWDGESLLSIEEFVNKYKMELVPRRDLLTEIPVEHWKRESDNINSPANLRYIRECEIFQGLSLPAVQAQVMDMKGWDIFISPPLEKHFIDKDDVTVFFAKGSTHTNYLTLEWRERDFSRWLTSVPLEESWNYYVLSPNMFKFWEGPAERRGTQFNPENAMQFSFGVAMSHSPVQPGMQSFWIAGLGVVKKDKAQEIFLNQSIALPKLELLYPDYKFYRSNSVVEVRVLGELLPDLNGELLSIPRDFSLFHPRPSAGGFNKGRMWRWSPLIEGFGEKMQYRGALSALMVYSEGKHKGSVVASFAIHDPQWYTEETTLRLLKKLAERMRTGIYFLDVGTEFYTYFPEQDIKIGANIVNLASTPQKDVQVEISLYDRNSNVLLRKKVFSDIEVSAQGTSRVEEFLERNTPLPQEIMVESRLHCEGKLLENVVQELNIWKEKERKEFITIKDGDFIYKGERWCPYGVNYMPSSGIGTEDFSYFEFWLGARSYDPKVIQRDLERIADMGMNSISVFLYHQSMKDQNLLDLLYRAEKLGLKINLSLRPGTPFDFEWEKVREMIEYYRLPLQDVIFAYDLAWEPMFPGSEGRKRWDREWEAWVINRYRSIENAEADWKYPIPRDKEGNITNPPDEQLMRDGEWQVMVCAYRRFLDTLLYKYYSRARRLVRSLDTEHAVSFRMTESSNPTNPNANPLPYDWYYLALAVDILEPEGYGRIGDWERIKPAIFQVQYGKLCNPHIPLIWAEMGFNVHRDSEEQLQKTLERQAQFYDDFLKMVLESGSDGIYFWWYPGGYRVNENSDYGIINPDGTYRPVSKIIKENANIFRRQTLRNIDHWIEIDRDSTARGISGVYEKVKDKFWKVWENGKFTGLKTAGTNTTSADCPLMAIGNTLYNGSNPLKYLDAFFEEVLIVVNDDEKIRLEDYKSEVTLVKNNISNLQLLIEATNLGEAKWLSSPEGMRKEGGVYLVVEGLIDKVMPLNKDISRGECVSFAIPIPIKSGEIRFQFESYGRAKFGEMREIKLNLR